LFYSENRAIHAYLRWMRTLYLSLIIACFSASAFGQSISYGPVIDVNEPNQGGLRPRIVINGDGQPVVLWGRSSPNANRVAVGTGMGFTPGVQVHIPGTVLPAVSDWQGSSIAAAGNTVWVVLKATPEDEKPIYVRRSDDGGLTWGDTIRVEPNNGLWSRFPSITVQDPDEPVVQYMEFDSGFMGARYVVSKMTGGIFNPPVQVSSPYAPGNVCDCCPAQIVSNGARMAAMYRNAGDDERVMWGAFSDDGGTTFPTGTKIDTTGWIISQCMSSGPDGVIAGDSIRYVWMSGVIQGSKVYTASASMVDGGIGHHRRLYSQPQNIIQNYPRIAGRGDTLGVVWQQSSGAQMEVLFSWSVTGPGGFGAPDTVNVDLAGMQQNPDIAYADGAFHIVWGEMGAGQVRYRKATLNNSVGIGTLANSDPALRVWPNPTNGIVHLESEEWIRAEIIDMSGRIVLHAKGSRSTIDVAALASGSYTIILYDRNGRSYQARFEKK
jgi:hypothetical protein